MANSIFNHDNRLVGLYSFTVDSNCDKVRKTKIGNAQWVSKTWQYCLVRSKWRNKANLRDLIAATGLVILLKFDPNHRFFVPCDLNFDGWPWKTIGQLFYTTSSFVHHFKSIDEFKLELQSGNAQFGSKSSIFCPVWPWNLTDDIEKL